MEAMSTHSSKTTTFSNKARPSITTRSINRSARPQSRMKWKRKSKSYVNRSVQNGNQRSSRRSNSKEAQAAQRLP